MHLWGVSTVCEMTYIWHRVYEGAEWCRGRGFGSRGSEEEQYVWAIVGELKVDVRVWRLWKRERDFYRRGRRVGIRGRSSHCGCWLGAWRGKLR